MSTLVAVLRADDGAVQFANAALENTLGLSRRTLEGADFSTFFTDPALLQTALAGAGKDFAALRYEASLKRLHQDPVPVHVNVADAEQVGEILVELAAGAAGPPGPRRAPARPGPGQQGADPQPGHEIKNPLGGIRGAAQLLEMELDNRELTEYTQVIIHEADRLQSLVDRLLPPPPPASGGRREHPRGCASGCARSCWSNTRRASRYSATTTPPSPSFVGTVRSSFRRC